MNKIIKMKIVTTFLMLLYGLVNLVVGLYIANDIMNENNRNILDYVVIICFLITTIIGINSFGNILGHFIDKEKKKIMFIKEDVNL